MKSITPVLCSAVLAATFATKHASASMESESWTFHFNNASGSYSSTSSKGNSLQLDLKGFRMKEGETPEDVSSDLAYWSGYGLGLQTNEYGYEEHAPWHGVDNKKFYEYLQFDFLGHDVSFDAFEFSYAKELEESVKHLVCEKSSKSAGSRKCNEWDEVEYVSSDDHRVGTKSDFGDHWKKTETSWEYDADATLRYSTDDGFEVLGNYLDVGSHQEVSTDTAKTADGHPTSDTWALGAFMNFLSSAPTYFANGAAAGANAWDNFADAFKLKSITVSKKMTPPTDVPVPATVLLLVFGLAHVVQRKKSSHCNLLAGHLRGYSEQTAGGRHRKPFVPKTSR